MSFDHAEKIVDWPLTPPKKKDFLMSGVKPLFRNARIVGSSFRDDHAKTIYAQLKVRDAVEFELEPSNEHDPFAVKVLADGVHVGYIPREMSAVLYATGVGEHIQAVVSEVGAKGGVMVTVGLVDE